MSFPGRSYTEKNMSEGERLMTCMYCYNLLPRKDMIYHTTNECIFTKGKNISPKFGPSYGYYRPSQGGSRFYNPLNHVPNTPRHFCTLGPTYRKEINQSSATQADVSESVIDKENSKYQELSSLDAKDVTLLTESMKELLIKGSDHDVTITVKEKQFQAHRIILKTRSPVFAMMLNHDSKESISGTIKIEDCDPDSFDEFLLYLYTGRTENLTPSKAFHLYYTADKYDLPALKERCTILLKTSLSVESICDVVLLATRHDEKELLEEATKFFAQNMREILVTVHWQEFLSKNPIEGNELYIKSMDVLVPRK